MSVESEKAHSFVQHLFSNPSLQRYTPLQREQQIRQFLEVNSQALMPTLTSGDFFPGYNWERVMEMIMSTTREKTDMLFAADIREVVSHRINYNFLREFGQSMLNYDEVQGQLLEIIDDMVAHPAARQQISGCYVAVLHNLFSRYLMESYNRQAYVHFEFTKVQRLALSIEQIYDLIKIILLLSPAIWIVRDEQYDEHAHDTSPLRITQPLIDKTLAYLKDRVGIIPEHILRSAINANVSFDEDNTIEATSRIAAIFAARGKHFRPNIIKDRGAESPDKSWFYISRRNYKYYGFDSKMLEEFYSIAAESEW